MTVLLLSVALIALPPGTLVDRVIAVVDKEVITHSELIKEARVALVKKAGERAASGELGPEFLARFLDDVLISQVLVAAQTRRLGSVEVSQEEVDGEIERFARMFRTRASHAAFLRRYDISDAALRNILRRDLRNGRYLDQRKRAWRVRAGPNADSGYQRDREALEEYLQELRSAADLRMLSPSGGLERQEAE
ncbi:MAG: hypothetical protein V3T05_01640 [Myxococcota bacterium]